MATGDNADQIARLKALLPPWFGGDNPIVTGLLTGIANAQAFLYNLIGFAKLQTRIKTATGGWLDMIAADFFGTMIVRGAGQSDTSLRNQIIAGLFRERGTRKSIVQVVTDLTGIVPDVFEPSRVQDTGGYGVAMGYGAAGRYGSLLLPFQAFVTAYRPVGVGIPSVAGYGISTGGYAVASQAEYASLSMAADAVTDAEIFAAIDSVKPVATIIWVRVGNVVFPPSGTRSSIIVGDDMLYFNDNLIQLQNWS